MSEALREEQRQDQIRHERAGDEQADEIGGHRRSVPRTRNPSSKNIAPVRSKNTASMT
jgi:hypothetical protein